MIGRMQRKHFFYNYIESCAMSECRWDKNLSATWKQHRITHKRYKTRGQKKTSELILSTQSAPSCAHAKCIKHAKKNDAISNRIHRIHITTMLLFCHCAVAPTEFISSPNHCFILVFFAIKDCSQRKEWIEHCTYTINVRAFFVVLFVVVIITVCCFCYCCCVFFFGFSKRYCFL